MMAMNLIRDHGGKEGEVSRNKGEKSRGGARVDEDYQLSFRERRDEDKR